MWNLKMRAPHALFVVFCFALAERGQAYPNYISYGYQSCLTCHYNPFGNGPLTDYGRALSATEISGRAFVSQKATEEQLADNSGFLGKPSANNWLRPSLSYRGLWLDRNYGKDTEKQEYINMDVSTAIVAKFLERDKLVVVGQIGYAPKPAQVKEDMDEYRSREHYVGYRETKEFGIYVGLMDKVFGIRIPDHIAFSRTITSLTQNDQTHGVVLHYATKQFEVGVQPFIGNLVQDQQLRQKGFTTMGEVSVGEFARVGASLLSSSSDFLEEFMYAGHARVGLGKGHSIMAEVGQVSRTIKEDHSTTDSRYIMTQSHARFGRGFWGLLTAEDVKANTHVGGHVYRIGPGLQYFPLQRLELRTDAYNTYSISSDKKTTSSWDLTAQVHIWL